MSPLKQWDLIGVRYSICWYSKARCCHGNWQSLVSASPVSIQTNNQRQSLVKLWGNVGLCGSCCLNQVNQACESKKHWHTLDKILLKYLIVADLWYIRVFLHFNCWELKAHSAECFVWLQPSVVVFAIFVSVSPVRIPSVFMGFFSWENSSPIKIDPGD